MTEYFHYRISWLVWSGLISAIFIPVLVPYLNQRRIQFRDFITFIGELRDSIERANDTKLDFSVYGPSIVPMRAKCISLRRYVLPWRQNRFDSAWQRYCDASNKDFTKTSDFMAASASAYGSDYVLIRDQILAELDAIVQSAK